MRTANATYLKCVWSALIFCTICEQIMVMQAKNRPRRRAQCKKTPKSYHQVLRMQTSWKKRGKDITAGGAIMDVMEDDEFGVFVLLVRWGQLHKGPCLMSQHCSSCLSMRTSVHLWPPLQGIQSFAKLSSTLPNRTRLHWWNANRLNYRGSFCGISVLFSGISNER